MGNFAALRSTQRVVVQIRDDSEQLLGFAVIRLTGLPLELLSGKDLTYVEGRRKLRLGSVDSAAVHITGQKHHIEHMRGDVHIRSTGTLVMFPRIQNRIDHGFGVNIIFTEVYPGVGTLKLQV